MMLMYSMNLFVKMCITDYTFLSYFRKLLPIQMMSQRFTFPHPLASLLHPSPQRTSESEPSALVQSPYRIPITMATGGQSQAVLTTSPPPPLSECKLPRLMAVRIRHGKWTHLMISMMMIPMYSSVFSIGRSFQSQLNWFTSNHLS